MNPQEEAQAIEEIAMRLQERFPDTDPMTVSRTVSDVHHDFDGRPIRDFVPLLVERGAVELLRQTPDRSPSLTA